MFAWQKDFRFYENQHFTHFNRQTAHSQWGCFENEAQALGGDKEASKYVLNLDGVWKFKLYDRPEDVPQDFFEKTAGFGTINVPGNWELQGHSAAIYTNVVMPFERKDGVNYCIRAKAGDNSNVDSLTPFEYNAPYVPNQSPTGCYVREFDLPADYADRDNFIYFEGVESAFHLWINGESVGYSHDSKVPCEFEVTSYLKKGKNTIALMVIRWSSSTWLEDQDYLYLAGIHRSVRLCSKPKMYIKDFKLDTVYKGMDSYVNASVQVCKKEFYGDYKVRLRLYRNDGYMFRDLEQPVGTGSQWPEEVYPVGGEGVALFKFGIEVPKPWTPETPFLYTITMTLIDPEGNEVDFESSKVGFKEIKIENGVIKLNGERFIFRGVDRHEFSPVGGRYVTREEMIADIKVMKQLNINAVRTSHYPNANLWYDLCDEYGILLVCETNLETHAVVADLSKDPAWNSNYMDRAMRMVLTHKNHASIAIWSLGNESGVGANHASMSAWMRYYDPTRAVQYEGCEPIPAISDIRCPMYPEIDKIMRLLTDKDDIRPVVLCEYAYQITNSGGGMNKFVELTETYDRFQGGFVWDFRDKCLLVGDKQKFYGYGGDFGEDFLDPRDPVFMCANGIVHADLTVKPSGLELKNVYSPLKVVFEEGKYYLKNTYHSRNTSSVAVFAQLTENGVEVECKELETPNIGPGERAELDAAFDYGCKNGCEYHINFFIKTKCALGLIDAGYTMYQTQFEHKVVTYVPKFLQLPAGGAKLTGKNGDYKVQAQTFAVEIKDGKVSVAGKAKVLDGFELNLCRGMTGLDYQKKWSRHADLKAAGYYDYQEKLESCIALQQGENVTVEIITSAIDKKVIARCLMTIGGDRFLVDYSVSVDTSLYAPHRLGFGIVLPKEFENLSFYGVGQESYPDRCNNGIKQVCTGKVADQHFVFTPPSENSGHERTDWVSLSDKKAVVTVTGEKPFHFDCRDYSVQTLRQATHDHLIKRGQATYLNIDLYHDGIGGNMAWSTRVDPEFRNKAGMHSARFEFVIS